MRHVRMLGLSLLVVLALAAVSSASASAAEGCKSGQILYGATCETAKEHATYQYLANCPFDAPLREGYETIEEDGTCVGGESFYTEHWNSKQQREEWEQAYGRPVPGLKSYFTAGKVTVPLRYSITLRGGLEPRIGGNEELEEFIWIGAEGAPTIEPVAQPSISLTKGVNKALLSPSELERFTYYTKVAKQTRTTAAVELAGPTEGVKVNIGNQLTEEGTAFTFPVKVHLRSPFLGENCYVGSDEHPIFVPFTTGQDGELRGKLGRIDFSNHGEILEIWGDTLVSSSFSSPGVENCGIDGGADEAIDSALGLPSATGNSSVLNGLLLLSSGVGTKEALEGKH